MLSFLPSGQAVFALRLKGRARLADFGFGFSAEAIIVRSRAIVVGRTNIGAQECAPTHTILLAKKQDAIKDASFLYIMYISLQMPIRQNNTAMNEHG